MQRQETDYFHCNTVSENIVHFEELFESGKISEITHTHSGLNIWEGTQGS